LFSGCWFISTFHLPTSTGFRAVYPAPEQPETVKGFLMFQRDRSANGLNDGALEMTDDLFSLASHFAFCLE
jgi:hypothetical protein